MALISLAISTISSRIDNLKLQSYSNAEYVIIHQHSNEGDPTVISNLKKRNDVVYIPLDKTGLSASRNTAIESSNGDYIFILDDDVCFYFEKMVSLVELMSKDNVDVGTCYHKYTNGKTTKNKEHSFFHNRLNIANPSSIDICLKRKSIIESGVLFDECFGLGTDYPSGEEMIFLSDCIKANLKLKRYPIEVCIHPPITSGSDFYSTKEKIIAKKAMFKRVYGQLGWFMFLLFTLKKCSTAYKAGYGIFFLKNSLFK